jgi:DNA-binding NarL/FixJ family response regulator
LVASGLPNLDGIGGRDIEKTLSPRFRLVIADEGSTTTMDKYQTQNVIRIFLIDEEPIVRAALVSLINSWQGFQINCEAAVDSAIEPLSRLGCDVVLLSLAGCEEADAATIKTVARLCGSAPLVVLVGDCSEEFRTQLSPLGATCVLLKTEHPRELQNVIQRVHETRKPRLLAQRAS